MTRINSILPAVHHEWRHPWQVVLRWDGEGEQWVGVIMPGLVRCVPPTTDGIELTDFPLIPMDQWRRLGPDAEPTGISASESGEIVLGFEAVPKFFLDLGVGPAPTANGTTINRSAADDRRLLRSMDLVLHQPRLSTASILRTSNGLDGLFLEALATYRLPADETPYIERTPLWVPPAPSDPLQQLFGIYSDTGLDSRVIAHLWLVSQPGTPDGAEIDATWTPYVQQQIWWNIDHAVRQLPPPLADTKLSLQTGLAAGAGDALNLYLTDQINTANSVISNYLSRNTVAAEIWSL